MLITNQVATAPGSDMMPGTGRHACPTQSLAFSSEGQVLYYPYALLVKK
jgi:hypothetical protein